MGKSKLFLNAFTMLMVGIVCLLILSACQRASLVAPILTIENESIKWQIIKNSDSYLISINNNVIETENNFYDISSLDEPGKSYIVKVMARNSTIKSRWSEELNLTRLLTPVLVVNGFDVNWEADENASAYEVTIADGLNTYVFTTENNWCNPSMQCGEVEDTLTVTVTAIGKNNNYLNSKISDAVNFFIYPQGAIFINSEEFFNDLANFNYSGIYYLTSNINLKKSSFKGFKDTFKGTFSGNNFKITLGDVIAEDNEFSGFFANINGALIKNLIIEANYSTSSGWVGILAGNAYNSEIYNIQTFGSISASITTDKITALAGLVEYAYNCIIINCENNASFLIEGNDFYSESQNSIFIGGIVAELCSSTLINCSNNGSLILKDAAMNSFIGGIAAYSKRKQGPEVLLENCVNNADITALNCTYLEVGGILGTIYYEQSGVQQIHACTNNGKITAGGFEAYVGGIAGTAYVFEVGNITNAAEIKNCSNLGIIRNETTATPEYVNDVCAWIEDEEYFFII